MGRIVIISLFTVGLFISSCNEILIDNEIFKFENEAEKLIVDFEINVLDSVSGIVQLIDKSKGADRVEWFGVHETGNIDYNFYEYGSLPGDTVTVQLKGLGTNLITLAAWKDVIVDYSLTQIHKSKSTEVIFKPIIKVRPYLSYVEFVNYPSKDKYGFDWDTDGSPPDVYIEMIIWKPKFAKTFLNTDLLVDLEKTDLPIKFISDSVVSLYEIEMDFIINDFDLKTENFTGNEMMERLSFFGNSLKFPKEETVTEYDLGDIKIGIQWLEN